jgi:hypothetical protein
MQGSPQDVVGAVAAMNVEGGGVQVADAEFDGAARDRHRRRLVDGRADGSTRQVLRAKAQPRYGERAIQLDGAHVGVDRRWRHWPSMVVGAAARQSTSVARISKQ